MFKEIVFVCFISAAFCYDFKDSHYNEFLMKDLIDTVSDERQISLPRFRRDADDSDSTCQPKKKTSDFNKCCNDNADQAANDHYSTYMEWKNQCTQAVRDKRKSEAVDVFACETISQTKEDLICISQCVGQKAQMISDDGSIDEAGLKDHLKNNVAYSQWQKDVSDDIADKCIAEVKDALQDQPDGKCSMAAIKMGHCLWREFTLACPKEFHKDSPRCNKIRENLGSGAKYDLGSYHRYHSDDAATADN